MDDISERKQNDPHANAFTVLQLIQETSKQLQSYAIFLTTNPQNTIKALLCLGNQLSTLIETDPTLYELSQSFSDLRTLLNELQSAQGYGLRHILRRQAIYYKIPQVACEIERQARAYVDKESILKLVRTLAESKDEEEQVKALVEFEQRLSQGFDLDYQELILKAKVFQILESILCDTNLARNIREQSALVIVALIRFNRNVFVGLVLMGPTVEALISMGSCRSIEVLTSLITLIRSPLIDEIESLGEIPRIMSHLSSGDTVTRVAAFNCICEVAYYGRKEVIEAMLEQGLIEKLLELQREEDEASAGEERRGGSVFDGCVGRFAVHVEVGEGLTSQERGEFKIEILRRVKEACVSEAEAASVCSEVLWGGS